MLSGKYDVLFGRQSRLLRTHPRCRCCHDLDAMSRGPSQAGAEDDKGNQRDEDDDDDQERDRDPVRSPTTRTVQLWRGIEEIEEAGAQCLMCNALAKILFKYNICSARHPTKRITLFLSLAQQNPEIAFDHLGSQKTIQLYTCMDLAAPRSWRGVPSLSDLCTDRWSAAGMSFIKSCLQACTNRHVSCHQRSGATPTRLLDLRCLEKDIIRLTEHCSGVDGAYAALSYCWGGAVMTKLTRGSLEVFKAGFGMDNLPQTFKDAIHLARELGILFIWIDALCIIQDSEQDWARESANMSVIYSNAHLTIAAGSGSAANSFMHRPESVEGEGDCLPSRPVGVWVRNSDSTQTEPVMLKARVIEESGRHWKWRENCEGYFNEPWSKRGWTLQEQLLSKRLLYMGPLEMQWTCQEAEFCECQSSLNSGRRFGASALCLGDDSVAVFRFWNKVVENYSMRNLSRGTDKLPAISGIADVIQGKTGSRYVAGMWTDNIDLDLLWRPSFTRTRQAPEDDRCIPSFSWASIHGEIDYYCFRNGKKPYQSMSEVLSVHSYPSNRHNALGQVMGGELILQGSVLRATIQFTSCDGFIRLDVGGIALELFPDTPIQEVARTWSGGEERWAACRSYCKKASFAVPIIGRDINNATMRLQFSAGLKLHLSRSPARPGTVCWVVQLGAFFDHYRKRCLDRELLVLGRSPRSPDCYERIGLVSYGGAELDDAFKASQPQEMKIV